MAETRQLQLMAAMQIDVAGADSIRVEDGKLLAAGVESRDTPATRATRARRGVHRQAQGPHGRVESRPDCWYNVGSGRWP